MRRGRGIIGGDTLDDAARADSTKLNLCFCSVRFIHVQKYQNSV
jgi:hypothetical protein